METILGWSDGSGETTTNLRIDGSGHCHVWSACDQDFSRYSKYVVSMLKCLKPECVACLNDTLAVLSANGGRGVGRFKFVKGSITVYKLTR